MKELRELQSVDPKNGKKKRKSSDTADDGEDQFENDITPDSIQPSKKAKKSRK